jgi:hypothetical protein
MEAGMTAMIDTGARIGGVSLEDVRWRLERRLSNVAAHIGLGSVFDTDSETIMAEIRDANGTVVLYVEVDQQTGDTIRYL